MERTFIIVKPDGVARGLVGAVLERFERRGFRLLKLEVRTIDRGLAAEHYSHLKGRPFFEGLLDAITEGPSVLAVLEREDAIKVARNIVGATNPSDALPGTVRGDLGGCLPRNVVHASDSRESYEREVGLFFPGEAWLLEVQEAKQE
ncbi:MAG TPA: nucleoside-diphosphate kinase [Firmicutes bacterium]|nr:nucleoside-diphosphate kinase [Bacillota bacterium]